MKRKNIRIIPKLDIKNGNLIKGINLEGLRVLGNPIYFASVTTLIKRKILSRFIDLIIID